MTCRVCGQENPAGFRFCGACGAPLAEAAPVREERKIVTAVFCDLVGSTARAEQLDPEDVSALLSRYHAHVRGELERFGGTVEKFIGDAVVALFGAPTAHEDDPERAVRAALAIREWVSDEPDLHVRIAVNTGAALVAVGARPETGEGMASGDVLNTAARLQSAAPVDGILVGEQTFRATERSIEYRAAEPVQAKGKAEPVPAWEVVQARSRLGVDVTRTGGAPLVGRDREVALLLGLLERARTEQLPQLVTVVGVPGIGKSRLLAELLAAVERGGRLITWRQGRSLPYGEGVTFWAFGEIVKAQAGILETDSAAEAARKLDDAVAVLLPEAAEAAWVASHLRPLAGVAGGSSSGAHARGEAFAAWRRFVEALAEARPLVLVFEDLHWGDEGLLDFVDELVERLTGVPALVIAVARPELLARRPAWGGGKPNSTTISLAPLTERETGRLVEALLTHTPLPPEAQAALLEHAGGNPLYAEEFVRMLVERGAVGEQLPESVHGIIAARLDGLDPADKALLQDAAVVGKVFWSGALAHVAEGSRFEIEERLHGLERRELVRRERRSSVAGETEFAFRHVLVRDVAYGTIPRAARADRHRRAAEWIESLGRPDDHADLLAHHYLAALELARAAGVDTGTLAESGAVALKRAGDRAFGLNTFPTAIRLYDEALSLGIAEGERPRLLFRLGLALHLVGDGRRVRVLEEARAAALGDGDAETAAEASAMLASAYWHAGDTERSYESIRRALELVAGLGDSPAAARTLSQAASQASIADTHADAIAAGTEAMRMQEALGLDYLMPDPSASVAMARAKLGEIDAAVAQMEGAIERAEASQSPDLARLRNNFAVMLWQHAGVAAAGEQFREAVRAADRFGNANTGRFVRGTLWFVDLAQGRWKEALAGADAFLVEFPGHYHEGAAHMIRARILVGQGDDAGAQAAARLALDRARAIADPQMVLPALATAAYVFDRVGDADAAAAAAEEILAFLRRGTSLDPKTPPLGLAVRSLRERTAAALDAVPATRFVEAVRLLVVGDLARAADRLAEHGDLATEAEVRWLAGDGERAEPFFRRVGATRFLSS